MARRKKERQEVTRFDPRLAELARAVRGEDEGASNGQAPTPELCEIALELADELSIYERRGGTAHLEDVIEQPAYRELFSRSESHTAWPRPAGRWDVVLRRGDATERVIGDAAGDWVVDGLRRLAALTHMEVRVFVDTAGHEDGLAPPPKQADAELEQLSRATRRGMVVTSGPSTGAYLTAGAINAAAAIMGDRPPRWHTDPSSNHEFRYWDGWAWTRFVFDSRGQRRVP
jgi:hypothetical protein